MSKIAIIGAGASGIIAALRLSIKNEVILLEKNAIIGKKILVTGNGKCNLWNSNLFNKEIDLKKYYYSDNYNILYNILKYKDKTYNYLTNELNINIKSKKEYIYPYSLSSSSVRKTLEKNIEINKNIEVICNFEVVNIKRENEKICVYGKDNSYYKVDKVILACGAKSSVLGTDTVNNLLNKNYHFLPSLVPLKTNKTELMSCNGLRVDANIKLYNNKKLIKEETGEIHITDYGISGIPIFNISGHAARLLNESQELNLIIDFMPEYTKGELLNKFNKNFFRDDLSIEDYLETIFNYKLLYALLKESKINKNSIWKKIKDSEKEILINKIKEFKVQIIDTLDFTRSQVSTGGVSLNDVNDKLELIDNKNIYVIGEALNIDGICGGYNLANAFITGFMMGDLND